MTLPAHRFAQRAQQDGQHVWVFDFDGTITGAPDQLARIATGLKGLGDRIIVLTGNKSTQPELEARLKDYDFPFDDLVQYHDDATDGIARAQHLKQFGAWGGFDNRVDRACILAKVCPHLYLIAEPTDESQAAAKAKGSKQAAKQAAKALSRSEQRSEAPPPPNLRVSESAEGEHPEHECGTCRMWDQGLCWGYGDFPTSGEWVCDSWELDPNWKQQDAAQDADDDI